MRLFLLADRLRFQFQGFAFLRNSQMDFRTTGPLSQSVYLVDNMFFKTVEIGLVASAVATIKLFVQRLYRDPSRFLSDTEAFRCIESRVAPQSLGSRRPTGLDGSQPAAVQLSQGVEARLECAQSEPLDRGSKASAMQLPDSRLDPEAKVLRGHASRSCQKAIKLDPESTHVLLDRGDLDVNAHASLRIGTE
jgi:hypothetical protein